MKIFKATLTVFSPAVSARRRPGRISLPGLRSLPLRQPFNAPPSANEPDSLRDMTRYNTATGMQ
jgi:hypothetical protein